MGSPYTSQTTSGYNSSPPADDGSQVASNQILWSTIKTKLADVLKTFGENINSAVSTAFGRVPGGASASATATSYQVLSSDQGKLIIATAPGVTITTPDATSVSSPFLFRVSNNSSGAITVDGSGSQTVDGASTISIPAGGGVELDTNGSNWFTAGQNYIGTIGPPQGRVTLTSATPVLTADVSAATSVYYTPYVGNQCPIYNGTLFQMRSFAELTLTLQNNANYAASTIYDLFIFDNSGTVTFGMGPAWSVSTAGSGSRGNGAGTTELEKKLGVWTNHNSMTARNGATTYTVAANQGTYVGSISMDASNGQVTCHVAIGQSRKWGIWNAYNRVPTRLRATDSTASWNYNTNAWRASNNASANSVTIFSGLPEDYYHLEFIQRITATASGVGLTGIGYNSTSSPTGRNGSSGNGGVASVVTNTDAVAVYQAPPTIGINTITALENAESSSSNIAWKGTESFHLLFAEWRA